MKKSILSVCLFLFPGTQSTTKPKTPNTRSGKTPTQRRDQKMRKDIAQTQRERQRETETESSLCYIFLVCRLEDYPSPEKQEASKLGNTTGKP
jgi:hypothetical protein